MPNLNFSQTTKTLRDVKTYSQASQPKLFVKVMNFSNTFNRSEIEKIDSEMANATSHFVIERNTAQPERQLPKQEN